MNKCCESSDNREVIEIVNSEELTAPNGVRYKSISRKEKCTKCSRKHYVMDVEPLELRYQADG